MRAKTLENILKFNYKFLLYTFTFALACIFSLQSSFAQVSIGGNNTGDLTITVEDNGSIQIEQFGSPQLSAAAFASGSILKSGTNLCGLGFNNAANTFPLDNSSINGDTIVTTVECRTAIGSTWAVWQQAVHYIPGNHAIIDWSITNPGEAALATIDFFHVQNTNIDGFTTPSEGFAQDSIYKVGATEISAATARVLSFQSFTPPFARISRSAGSLFTEISTGDLLDTPNPFIETTPHSFNAFAMQWQKGDLQPGETWILAGLEQLLSADVSDEIYIIAPAEIEISPGVPVTYPALLVNSGTSPKNVVLNASSSLLDWTVSSPSTITINPLDQSDVLLTVDAPLTALDGDRTAITLEALASGVPVTGETLVRAFFPPIITPTPSPTPSPTSIPDPIDVTITFPYNSTGPLTPNITGKSFPGSKISLFIDAIDVANDMPIARTESDPAGEWLISIAEPLKIGAHTLLASATDPLLRVSSSKPFSLFATGGAELDFEGDGYTDLVSYRNLGSSVIFRISKSSQAPSSVEYVKGVVPAVADYDGDYITDFAAIRRSGKSFIWSANLSYFQNEKEITFGERGDKLITGCHFTTGQFHSLAAFRGSDLLFQDIYNETIEKVDDILPSNLSFIGCADIDEDGVDELITSSGSSNKSIIAINLAKDRRELKSDLNFSRSYVMRQPRDLEPMLLLVKAESASRRNIQPISLLGESSFANIDAPRKLILGNALVPFQSLQSPTEGFYFHDLKSGKVFGYLLGETEINDSIDTLAKGSRVVVPQYIYPTR